jgi:hypothetical protein
MRNRPRPFPPAGSTRVRNGTRLLSSGFTGDGRDVFGSISASAVSPGYEKNASSPTFSRRGFTSATHIGSKIKRPGNQLKGGYQEQLKLAQ